MIETVSAILVDARNFHLLAPTIIQKMSTASIAGFDIETHDAGRHDGLNAFMKADAEGRKSNARPLVFDVNRTVVTGFSLYVDGDNLAYYVNLNHADAENRVDWAQARMLIDALPADGMFVCHNAPFEITMMGKSLGYDLAGRTICTLQMAVSAYGPDEYDTTDFANHGLGAIGRLLGEASSAYLGFDRSQPKTPAQTELFNKVCGKESKADHSYNGWVEEISRPYDLKRCVRYWFGYQMQTFEETLDGEVHMGKLTGEQVVGYGADDAVWAVRLYHRLLKYMLETNPKVVSTFFTQENPMTEFYADLWQKGMVVDSDSVKAKREEERSTFAGVLRELKAAIRQLLPFPAELHEGLLKYDEKWYGKNHGKYRSQLEAWANTPDVGDFEECHRVRGAVPNAWAADLGRPESKGLNLGHYMPVRVMLFDLTREKILVFKGKTESDGEGRGRLKERLEKQEPSARRDASIQLIDCLGRMASIEQRAKLYLNPYLQLIDPETDRVYPVLSSKLATRRMAMSYPNGMQLAKKGESTYVRGFFRPDYPDHVVLSCDWSAVELVAIGDFSGDPEFKVAFGQLPYQDLHLGAAASCLSVIWGEDAARALGMDDPVAAMEHALKRMKAGASAEEIQQIHPKLLVNLKGEPMAPGKALKFWRGTDCGKGANFNYWYSGALSTVGDRLGWSSDQMWEATDRYRQRFAVAEEWRKRVILTAQELGYVELPDGHRRVRFEATQHWATLFGNKFKAYQNEGIDAFADTIIRSIRTRANNQAVNSMIQGSCAAMAKRSILRLCRAIKDAGWTDREARVLVPIHDEILVSVHKDLVVPTIAMQRRAMCEPDIIRSLPLTVAPAIGRTFEPFSKSKARLTQIELEELSELDWLPADRIGKAANDDEIRAIVDWMFRKEAA